VNLLKLQVALGCLILAQACGGSVAPEAVTAAKAAVRAAEVAGAEDEPNAALQLKHARDQIAQAEKLIQEEEDPQAATWLLRRAEVDADLALALSEERKTVAEAQEAKDDLEKLKKQLASD
jgi:hypothetical protein